MGTATGLPGAHLRRAGRAPRSAVARRAWDYLAGSEGYGRVDLRVDDAGQRVGARGESLPRHLASDAGLARMGAPRAGRTRRCCSASWTRRSTAGARRRPRHDGPVPASGAERSAPHDGRGTRGSGRSRRPTATASRRSPVPSGLFGDDEIPVALEVFDAAVAGSGDDTALGAGRRRGRSPAGSAGDRRPAPSGTYDLYWIAVDPAQLQTRGSALPLAEMERQLAGVARLVVVETAGRRGYARHSRRSTRQRGYTAAAAHPGLLCPGRRPGRLHQGHHR
ncbi:MAG: hypothetical protein MZV64_30195 [Ignavibacteriales bacterium]|nr:hypothetical protein [Ignavibacteriales bacterium]